MVASAVIVGHNHYWLLNSLIGKGQRWDMAG